jgi:hypothetical protein
MDMTKTQIGFSVWAAALLFAVSAERVHAGDVVYVQAAKATLRSAPQLQAAAVVDLTRGTELKVLEKSNLWFKVSSKNQQGWVSKLAVNEHRPVGEATLAAELQGSLEKASRKRQGAYAVSASTRGLSASTDRSREGREAYRSDFSSVEKMDQITLPAAEIDKFSKSVNLFQ